MGRTVQGGKRQRNIEYAALPSQSVFHASRARFKGFSGPIGSGKSAALCQEAVKLSYINAGRCGLIGAPTYPMLRDATQAALLAILDKNGLPYSFNRSENTLVMKDTGSKILLRSLDEYERLRGTNLAWFGVDELTYVAQEAWVRLEGRLRDPKARRLCGFAVWTPKGHDWVYQRFLAAKVEGYDVVIARPMENRHILDKIPDFYERLKHSYDEKFYLQEVMGEYLNSKEGLVYHAFDAAANVRDVELLAGKPLLWAMDFNVDPMSSVVAQIDGSEVRVVDEIVLPRASTGQACEEFVNRFGKHKTGVKVYGDASGYASKTSGRTDYEIVRRALDEAEFEKVSFHAARRNPPVRDRVALVNAKLKNAAGDVELLVSKKCKELVKDFLEVTYKEGSGVIDKERDAKRTHLSDALGYLLWETREQRVKFGGRQERLLA